MKESDLDQLQINFQQAPDGFIAIHAYKKEKGKGCKYFEVPEEWLEHDDFFDMVYKEALIQWKKPKMITLEKCPVCTHAFLSFHWLYKGKYFCRWCGSHYDRDGAKVIVTRRLGEI